MEIIFSTNYIKNRTGTIAFQTVCTFWSAVYGCIVTASVCLWYFSFKYSCYDV